MILLITVVLFILGVCLIGVLAAEVKKAQRPVRPNRVYTPPQTAKPYMPSSDNGQQARFMAVARQRKQQSVSSSTSPQKRQPGNSSASAQPRGKIPAAQENRLIQLLNGDRPGAYRLVAAIREKHLNQTEQWCWEKAIFDLERDRL